MRKKEILIMTNKEFIAKVAKVTGATQENTKVMYNGFVEEIKKAVEAGDSVALIGLGIIEGVTKKERKGVNPQTGEKITIPAKKSVHFKASKTFVDSMNA